MNIRTLATTASILLTLWCSKTHAHEPYRATATLGIFSTTVTDPNLVDLLRDLRSIRLQSRLPGYTEVASISLDFNLRGVLALGSFPENSTSFIVQIPQAGITETFTGATRQDSLALFKESIKEAGRRHRLLRAYSRYSPIDPIAGNPKSLVAEMAQADYTLSHLSPLCGCNTCWSAQPIVHQFQAGGGVTRYHSRRFDGTSLHIPLRYSYSPNLKWALILDAPFTYNINGGASSVFSSLGVGLRLPLTNAWALTQTCRFGFGGSFDLCTAGAFISTGVSSVYNLNIKNFVFSMTNYAGYSTSMNLWLSGINFNYHLHNYILKNGLMVTTCNGFQFWGRPTNANITFTDSYFGKDRLFLRHYDEVEVSLVINNLNPNITYDCAVLGLAYQFGEKNYHGYCAKLTYQF